MNEIKFDEIGYWSEIKLDIIRRYALEYSRILSNQKNMSHIYIDAFAGYGTHKSKTSKELIDGSPIIALNTYPPFDEYHFIDIKKNKVTYLEHEINSKYDKEIIGRTRIYQKDCNDVLMNDILPKITYESYKRAFCLLDPYGLHLNWNVIELAGKLKTIDIFLNFPVMDMQMNVFWTKNIDQRNASDLKRMTSYWGDNSWEDVVYEQTSDLFGETELDKRHISAVVSKFRERLKQVAGFSNVPKPIPLRNTSGTIVYFLFFASPKKVANDIVEYIFKMYRNKGIK